MTPDQLVTASATIATAAATGVLAWVTWLLWKSTREMAAATRDPFVVVTLEPNRWTFIHLDMVVENTGAGPAFDVRISFEPPIERDRAGGGSPKYLERVSVMRPGTLLYDKVGDGAPFLERAYYVSVSWKTSPHARKRVEMRYPFDLQHYQGFSRLGGGDPLIEVAKELRNLRKVMEPVFSGFKRLEADVYTEIDRKREAEELERRWAANDESAHAVEPPKQGGDPSG